MNGKWKEDGFGRPPLDRSYLLERLFRATNSDTEFFFPGCRDRRLELESCSRDFGSGLLVIGAVNRRRILRGDLSICFAILREGSIWRM